MYQVTIKILKIGYFETFTYKKAVTSKLQV